MRTHKLAEKYMFFFGRVVVVVDVVTFLAPRNKRKGDYRLRPTCVLVQAVFE